LINDPDLTNDRDPVPVARPSGCAPLQGLSLFTVLADSLDEARQKFRNAGNSDSDALFIIKTETEIYLA
jgi:hypothetical protein